ncbi:hypothetical protein KC19_1G040800 [Ceratodon purpureus]|uniref:Uncharacterized protein n=1 Tax=Ceratodon purpureus TaxID=3225 RepID=A0A8T0J4L3_CERPU|nr:hypothetical protein KC19_1G040800 [Ceratodon purpureus]
MADWSDFHQRLYFTFRKFIIFKDQQMPFFLGLHPQGDEWCLYYLLGQGCKQAFHFLYIYLNNQRWESDISALRFDYSLFGHRMWIISLKKMTGIKRLQPLGIKCHNHTCRMQVHEVDTSHLYLNHVEEIIQVKYFKILTTYFMF